MANIADSVLDLVGKTPLVRFGKLEEELGFSGRIVAKLEYLNPGASIKDRIAKEIIEGAEREGRLKPGGTIIEASSGNTGIGLALIGAIKGYRTVIVMPDSASEERISILKLLGAEVFLTPAAEGMPGAGKKAAEILENTQNAIIAGQGGNPDNPKAHYEHTGPEIWDDLDGDVDILVSAVGTGGTLSGAGRYLKEKNKELKIVAVEPAGSPVLSGGTHGLHKIQGIGGGTIAPVTDQTLIDETITVTDEDAFESTKTLIKNEGIFAGISAGAAIWAVEQIAARPENKGKTIVTVIPDSIERNLSTDITIGL